MRKQDHAFKQSCGRTAVCALWVLMISACSGENGSADQGTAGNTTSAAVTSTNAGTSNSSVTGASTTTGGGTTTGVSSTGTGGSGTGNVGTGGSSNTSSLTTSGNANTGAGGSGTTGDSGGGNDTVTRSASSFTFQHFPLETNSDAVWSGAMTPGEQPTSTTYDTIVLENGYLRVTLLPDYGGRILSIVHKPTDRELLYQNPIGTPYLMYEDIFYYDYLVIMGGIFPSFPEPEHGRYWNQPYDFEVVDETPEAITVRMSRQDDRELASGVPAVYDVGRTDVLVELDVTLRAGSTSLELATKLTNTRDSAIPAFEYWTVTTLAPGSAPGATAIPLNTRILAAMDRVHLLESSWAWFGSAETRIEGEVFSWNNLSYFENWEDQGTGFANPSYQAGWSGLVNYDNDMGILRVSENVETPGLKLWTFGKGSLDIDINDSTEWLRPTIEMWHGVTPEFWDRATLAANEVRQWSDNYFPTLGLREVTAASAYGAVYLERTDSGSDSLLSATATLTVPEQTVQAILRLNGNVIHEQDLVVASSEASVVSANLASGEIAPGAVFEAEFVLGDQSLLVGQLTLP